MVAQALDAGRLIFVDETGANIWLAPLYARAAPKGELRGAAQPQQDDAAREHKPRGDPTVLGGGRERHQGVGYGP